MRLAIATLGCKINQYDSSFMGECLKKKGHALIPFGPGADLYIINTCTVTRKTDMKSRQLIRKAHRIGKGAPVIVTGCYAQVNSDAISAIEGVRCVLGNREKEEIVRFVEEAAESPAGRGTIPRVQVGEIEGEHELRVFDAKSFSGRTRSFLKIQDGCNERCAYCIIPRARGRSRSAEPERVLAQLEDLGEEGYKEAVLCGIHLGAYGLDLTPPSTLVRLLGEVAHRRSLPRIRLSSIEPGEISTALLGLMKRESIFCDHLHIPMQSGDDDVLRRMGRPYDTAFFNRLIERVTEALPDAAIGLDVIVGFPGEGEDAFQRTANLIETLPVAYLHIFPYSNRNGTRASQMPDQVQHETIRRRCNELRRLGRAKKMAFASRFVGTTLPVLIENQMDEVTGCMKGFTRNYIPVLVEGADEGTANSEIGVCIERTEGTKVFGKIPPPGPSHS